jgi:hypothetical protein
LVPAEDDAMVQNGYAIFFLLMLAAALASLVRSFGESWARIANALAPEEPCPVAAVYSTRLVPAAEVPWVAQRLVLRELDEPLPEPSAFAAWTVRPVSFAASEPGC